MKLLLDENLSRRLLSIIEPHFPGSTHVVLVGLQQTDDRVILDWAGEHDFVLVTKDADFVGLAALRQAVRPKLIWLRCGNRPVLYVANRLLEHRAAIETHFAGPDWVSVQIT